jgi:hypothetical protein
MSDLVQYNLEDDPFDENAISFAPVLAAKIQAPPEPPKINVIYDDETMATVDEETGEIYGLVAAPSGTENIKDIAEWLGEKLTWIDARLAGLTAEKQSWLDKVSKMYDPRLNHFHRLRDYLIALYKPIFDVYAKGAIFNDDGSLKTRSKTIKIGLLRMNFRTTRARTDVLKEAEAVELIRQEIAWRKEQGDEETARQLKVSIKITRSLLKSALPLDVPITLDPDDDFSVFLTPDDLLIREQSGEVEPPSVPLKLYLEKKGLLHFYDGGEEQFELG